MSHLHAVIIKINIDLHPHSQIIRRGTVPWFWFGEIISVCYAAHLVYWWHTAKWNGDCCSLLFCRESIVFFTRCASVAGSAVAVCHRRVLSRRIDGHRPDSPRVIQKVGEWVLNVDAYSLSVRLPCSAPAVFPSDAIHRVSWAGAAVSGTVPAGRDHPSARETQWPRRCRWGRARSPVRGIGGGLGTRSGIRTR